MNNPQKNKNIQSGEKFYKEIEKKQKRKEAEQRDKYKDVWFGLGMIGIVGWSVAVPTLLGVALGAWIDRKYPSNASWTLTFLLIGVIIGCINAWHWVKNSSRDGKE